MANDGNVLETTSDLINDIDPEEILDNQNIDDLPEEEEVDSADLEGEEISPEDELEEESELDQETENEDGLPIDLVGLAAAIEVEPEYLYQLEVGMGDGQDPIKLGELKDKYLGSVRETQNLQEQITGLNQKFTEEINSANMGQQMNNDMVSALADIRYIENQEQSIDWEEFRKADPGEAAFKKQQISDIKQQAHYNFQQAQQIAQQQSSAALNSYRAEQSQKISANHPQWNDAAVASKEIGGIHNMLKTDYGFNEKEVLAIEDNRIVKMLYDLMTLKAKSAEADDAVTKIRKAPRVLKPGATIRGRRTRKSKSDKIIDHGTKSVHHEDKVRAVGALLNQ